MGKALIIAICVGAMACGCTTFHKPGISSGAEAQDGVEVASIGVRNETPEDTQGDADKREAVSRKPRPRIRKQEKASGTASVAEVPTVNVVDVASVTETEEALYPAVSASRPADKATPEPVRDPIAYDRITLSRFLITMAREYYGNGDFWPYIYEENNFGHPDRITPGTSVAIPSLTKYGVDPENPADIEKAKKKGKAIYARYGKYI